MIKSECGKHLLEFDEEKHLYFFNGDVIPGVTTVKEKSLPTPFFLTAWKVKVAIEHLLESLSSVDLPVGKMTKKALDASVKAAKGAGKKKAKEAADIGTLIHDYAEQFESVGKINDELRKKIISSKDSSKIYSCIKKFRRWLRQNHDKVIKHEEICASVLYKFGGKFDRLAVRNGRIVLSDYKTSKGIYDEMFIQLGGYAIAILEWFGIQVEAIEIIRFGKENGEFEVKTINDSNEINALKRQFIRCIDTYNFFRERESLAKRS
jgi:ATP-dependent exoDNAse (exonuclease V) beta subunit